MGKIGFICQECGTAFFVYPSRVKHGNVRFCRRDCATKARAVGFDMKEWRSKNRVKLNDRSREYTRSHKEQRRETVRRYAAKNAARIKMLAAIRRGPLRRKGAASPGDVAKIMGRANGRCVYCGKESKLSLDHVIPLTRGGDHKKRNLIPACKSCNSKKCNRPVEDWLEAEYGLAGLGRAILFLERRPIPAPLLA